VGKVTLAIIKPDILTGPSAESNVDRILNKAQQNGFKILKSQRLTLSKNEAEKFYESHKGKFFYQRLISFMSSGPIQPVLLSREDAVARWRSVIGPTHKERAQRESPDSIRGSFGTSDTRNAIHGSGSNEEALSEIEFFFPGELSNQKTTQQK